MKHSQPIFAIEDDGSALDSLSWILEQRGHEVHPFGSAEQFLQTVGPESVGCVITDLIMPGMDGRQLQEELSTAAPAISVIVVTGYADVPTTVQLMNLGAVTVLEKPVDAAALLAAVAQGAAKSAEIGWRLRRVQEIQRRIAALTEEEREIAGSMIAGMPIKALARHMRISMRTVDRRRQSILAKMRAGSIGELASLFSEGSPDLETRVTPTFRVDRPGAIPSPRMHGRLEREEQNRSFSEIGPRPG